MSYKAGIANAIEELKDRKGSSVIVIKKAMESKQPKDKKWQNITFLNAVKSSVKAGDLLQIKNSFKLSPDFKKKQADALKPKKVTKKSVVKKSSTKKIMKKTTTVKKSTTKKTTTAKNVSKKKPNSKKATLKKKIVSKSVSKKKPAIKKTASKKKVGKKTTEKTNTADMQHILLDNSSSDEDHDNDLDEVNTGTESVEAEVAVKIQAEQKEKQQQQQKQQQQKQQQRNNHTLSNSLSMPVAPSVRVVPSSIVEVSTKKVKSSTSTAYSKHAVPSVTLCPFCFKTNVSPAERDAKLRKERFLVFTYVLMKYLERKDPKMHASANSVIKECAERNKQKDPEYLSLTASIQRRLRPTVGELYWKKAKKYLTYFVRQKLAQNDAIRKKRKVE